MSRTSPRTLLLHMPLTDLQRRIYRLADSRSGTLESPAGRFFDPSAVGSMTTARLRSHFSSVPASPACVRTTVLVLVVYTPPL